MKHSGARPLVWCAFRAWDLEAAGMPWGVMALCAEYAQHNGGTQWHAWRSIQEVLRRGQGPAQPGAALRELVRGVG